MIDTEQLHRIVNKMAETRVLVVGDIMLDMYEHCVVKRISPEAPVPIATVINDSFFLGGAGNVANNARALGAQVSFIGVIGNDQEGSVIQRLLDEQGINRDGLIVDAERITTVKKRVVSGTQQLIRIDRETNTDITEATDQKLRVLFLQLIGDHDVVVVSDYCKGLLTQSIIDFIKSESKKCNKKVFVDSKDKSLTKYADVYLIKPNKEEAEHFASERFTHTYSNLEPIGKKLSQMFGSNIVITLGADGIAFFEGDGFEHKNTRAQQVFDVSGAGDTVLSVIALAVAAGADLGSAVDLSNHAAGHVVSKLGTVVCDQETLRTCIVNFST